MHVFLSLQGFHISWRQILCHGTICWSLWWDSLDLHSWTPQFCSWHLRPWFQHILSHGTCRQQSIQGFQHKGKDYWSACKQSKLHLYLRCHLQESSFKISDISFCAFISKWQWSDDGKWGKWQMGSDMQQRSSAGLEPLKFWLMVGALIPTPPVPPLSFCFINRSPTLPRRSKVLLALKGF